MLLFLIGEAYLILDAEAKGYGKNKKPNTTTVQIVILGFS
jgi:hypothetical protein